MKEIIFVCTLRCKCNLLQKNIQLIIVFLLQTSHDPTAYVQRARVTRAAPPKPATNPLQFIQIKPCQLYQSSQDQLKRAEEVKKVKEVKKEEPEDWQSVSETFFSVFFYIMPIIYVCMYYNICHRDAMILCEYCVNGRRYCGLFENIHIYEWFVYGDKVRHDQLIMCVGECAYALDLYVFIRNLGCNDKEP